MKIDTSLIFKYTTFQILFPATVCSKSIPALHRIPFPLKLQVVIPSPLLLPHIQFEVPYRYELHFLRQIVPAYHGKYR